jgi:hypothetical protein
MKHLKNNDNNNNNNNKITGVGGAGGVEEGSGVTNQPQVTIPSPGELQASVEQPHDRS